MNRINNDHLTYINHRFVSTFRVDSDTKYKCPHCQVGNLRCNENDLCIEETPESKLERHEDDWEPEWVRYAFSGALICKSCHEKTFCTGTGSLEFHSYYDPEENTPKNISEYYDIELTPKYFEPSLFIFTIPNKCPLKIKDAAKHAFKLAFLDFSASGNRVRTCLEFYTDQLNPNATGTLHSKIESLKNIDADICELLMAIKWLGNQGSHETSLEEYDLAFAFEALEFCLTKTYDNNESKLKKLASLINSNKGSIAKN